MAGRLYAVVGPSGAGKDTLIAAARAKRADLRIARRAITRTRSGHDAEIFEPVTRAEFDRRAAAGEFALHWRAHGLCYGISRDIERALAEGRDVVFNASRAMLGPAWEEFPCLVCIHVTARPAVLAERLAARGREDRAEIARRLARAHYEIPYGIPIRVVENNGALGDAVAAFLAALQPERG